MMETNHRGSMEEALGKTEADADAACRAATTALRALKKFRAAAQAGNLRDLQKTIEAAGQAIAEQWLCSSDRAILIYRPHPGHIKPA
jgi:hypothetical protein